MPKNIKAYGIALLGLLTAAALLSRLGAAMPAAEVIRKLAGMRLALALHRIEHKTFPSSFGQLPAGGNLEAIPEIKLAWHGRSAKVADVRSFGIRDTGAWAYVSEPASAQFGLVYIDCRHRDEKGRFWSEF